MRDDRRTDTVESFGDAALSFVEKVASLRTVAEVYRLFDRTMSHDFGFDHFIMADVPPRRSIGMPRVMLSKAPIGWTEHYLANAFHKIDPVLEGCRGAAQPFGWAELAGAGNLPAASRHVMGLARDFGLRDGLSIPIHNVDGTTSCVSLSASGPHLAHQAQPAIHLMAIYAFEQVRQLNAANASAEPVLTGREIEVMTWAAAGKSAAAIADILDITERTVVAHTLNATHKLGAANKTHAVALALKHRLIAI